jgi:hypothetical protein
MNNLSDRITEKVGGAQMTTTQEALIAGVLLGLAAGFALAWGML